jgi:hypothetical protein
MARPRRVCPAWVGEQSKHGCAEAQWPTPRRRRRTDGARLRRNPNLRRGRLHRPALPVQPRSMLRDPPRVGRAGGDSAAATPPLSCRGPMVSSPRWPLQRGHPRRRGRLPTPLGGTPRLMLRTIRLVPSGANATDHAPHGNKAGPASRSVPDETRVGGQRGHRRSDRAAARERSQRRRRQRRLEREHTELLEELRALIPDARSCSASSSPSALPAHSPT